MQQERKKLLKSDEAAAYLGFSLSHLRKLMMRREIPMYKPNGKTCFFDTDDLDAYLHRIRIASQDEIEAEAQRRLQDMNSCNARRR